MTEDKMVRWYQRLNGPEFEQALGDTVEVTNRFHGLDLVDRVPEELWTEVHRRQ